MFKINDTIIAKAPGYPRMLTAGKEYTVISVQDGGRLVYVKDDSGKEGGWYASRFEAKPAAPVKQVPSESGLSPQCVTVLRHLKRAGTITQREALMDHGVQSLTKRIADLRAAGWNIPSEFRKHPTSGQRYMRYTLAA